MAHTTPLTYDLDDTFAIATSAEIIKGYEVGKGQYIEINPEELEAIALESKRTIEIDEFVPKSWQPDRALAISRSS